MKKVKDDPDYLNKLNLSPEQKHKFNEFKDKDLKNETNRKKLWDLWLDNIGGWANTWNWKGGTAGNDSWYTMDQNKVMKGKILINLGWPTINVDQFDWKTPEQIAAMISTWITEKAEDFKKKPVNVDDLKKMLDSYGLKGSKITEKITIASDLIQPTSNPKEGGNWKDAQGNRNSWGWWSWWR